MGKQKQTCHGPMIGLPSYQTWGGWIPPTLRTVGAMGTQKAKSGKFLLYPPFQRPRPVGAHQYYTSSGAPGRAHKISTDIPLMLPPFLQRWKCPKFWLKFRPKSSSDRRIFELRHFIANQKQT